MQQLPVYLFLICTSILQRMVNLRSKKIRNGYSLYIDYYYKGKRDIEYLNITVSQDYTSGKKSKRISPEDKKKWDFARELFLDKELAFIRNGNAYKKPGPALDWAKYVADKVVEKNHYTYSAMLKWLNKFAVESKFEPTTVWVDSFQKYLKSQKLGDTSIHHYLNRLRIIFNIAVDDEILTKNPFDKVNVTAKNERTQIHLDVNEIATLDSIEAGAPLSVRVAFLFACYTGLRYSELQALKWADIHADGQIPYIEFVQKKNKKSRIVQLHEYPLSLLKRLMPGTENENEKVLVFNLPPNNVANDFIRAWCAEAKITKAVHFHSARHTFGTMLHDTGTDIYTIQEMYGHSSVELSKSYTQVTDKKRISAINSLQNPLKL